MPIVSVSPSFEKPLKEGRIPSFPRLVRVAEFRTSFKPRRAEVAVVGERRGHAEPQVVWTPLPIQGRLW
jgi:hypothetical protein